MTFLGFVIGYFYIPETRKRTVDELDALFKANVKPRHFSKAPVSVDGGAVHVRQTFEHEEK